VAGVEPFGDLVGRDFRPPAPNLVWCADIKRIRTGAGWLYLAAVQDLFSRRIVGWGMAAHRPFQRRDARAGSEAGQQPGDPGRRSPSGRADTPETGPCGRPAIDCDHP
jgi:transposase InsO family protein